MYARHPLAGSVTRLLPVQRALVAALLVDAILVLVGVVLVPPAVQSVSGLGRIVADLGLFFVIAAAALIGPVGLRRIADVADVCLWAGCAFAALYATELVLDFSGRGFGLNPIWLFVATALVASGWASYRTRRLSRGIAAAAWGLVVGTALWSVALMVISYAYWHTHSGFEFWLRDGAVADFRRSSATSLWPFLLQDIQGAVFFHPFLSAAVGALCGAIGAAGALSGRALVARAVESP